MNRTRLHVRLFLWTAVLLALIWVGVGDRLLSHWAYAFERGRLQAATEELADLQDAGGLQTISKAFRLVAKVARPGVVHINVSGGGLDRISQDDIDQMREQLGGMLTDEQIEQFLLRRLPPAAGSGFLFDTNGHIVTNCHVVQGRPEIAVTLNNERTYEARLVGIDPKTDLAVVKIDATDLHPLVFGDSDKAEVGDWVVAIGAPFGLSQTVTHGIVSATGRTRVEEREVLYQNFIQTDTAINPGNSGGPLLNLRGEVVGVNTAIATNGEAVNAGVAFSIPANMARRVAEELVEHGIVSRGWLGISYPTAALTEDDAKIFKLPDTRGILISTVHEDSPADNAGLQVEDVIVAVNGEVIRDGEYFKSLIADLGPDELVRVRFIRDGEERELDIRLGLQPNDMVAARRAPAIDSRGIPRLGLRGCTFHPGLLTMFMQARAFDETDRGVFVVSIEGVVEGRPRVGAGELIVACDGEEVTTVGELLKALDSVRPGEDVRLQVLDPQGDRRIVRVKTKGGS
ncbi:MAG: trypsin-like peptidase domain-containing protein [Phycisphaerae bacterium]|jgi:serine protease Do